MRYSKLKKLINRLDELNITNTLQILSTEILSAMVDVNHGRRFVSKDEFITDFSEWVKEQYGDDCTNKFNLGTSIPNNTTLDVSFMDVPMKLFTDDMNHSYHIWTAEIHNDYPYKLSDGDRIVRVNAVAKIMHSKNPEDTSKTITTCVILTADKKLFRDRFTHVVRHELVHFILSCLVDLSKIQPELYENNKATDYDKMIGEEFIADFIPYKLNSDEYAISPLVRFQNDFYIRFNPIYSKIYETILKNIPDNQFRTPL